MRKIKHKLTKQIRNRPASKNATIDDNIKYISFTYYGNIIQKLNTLFKDTILKCLKTQIIKF